MRAVKFFLFSLLTGLAVAFLSACTTVGGMTKASFDKGIVQGYDVPYEKAFQLAKHACAVYSFEIENEDYQSRFIIAKNGMSVMSYGERIGIYFREDSEKQTSVSVVTKPKLKTNIFAPDWAAEIHMAMQNRLRQLQSVKTST